MDIENIFLAFFIKHYICDFPLQRWPYMYLNKGTYGHMGGIIHAGIHGVGTVIIMTLFGLPGLVVGIIDMVAHYHIDWAKMKLGKIYNLKPDNSEWYWHLLGLDQLLHYVTYYAIIKVLI